MRIKSGITDWIDKEAKKPGAFTNYCKKHGYKGVTKDCINKANKSKNHKTRIRAKLAKTFRKINKK